MADATGPVLTDIADRVLAKEEIRNSGLQQLSEVLEIVKSLSHGPHKDDMKDWITNYSRALLTHTLEAYKH